MDCVQKILNLDGYAKRRKEQLEKERELDIKMSENFEKCPKEIYNFLKNLTAIL